MPVYTVGVAGAPVERLSKDSGDSTSSIGTKFFNVAEW